MHATWSENLSKYERVGRGVLGAAIVLAVLISPSFPAWLAILAAYLVLTAEVGWDPFYGFGDALNLGHGPRLPQRMHRLAH